MKKVLILSSFIIVAICLIGILLYIWLPQYNNKYGMDSNENILENYNSYINIPDTFSKSNELTQVATRFSVLYADNKKREMYVFPIPIRNYFDGHYNIIDNTISSINGELLTSNEEYTIKYFKDSIHLKSTSNTLILYIEDTKEFYKCNGIEDTHYNYETLCYTSNENDKILVNPCYNGLVFQIQLTEKETAYSLPISFGKCKVKQEESGYIILRSKESKDNEPLNNNYFLISNPLIYDSTGNLITEGDFSVENNSVGDFLKCYFGNEVQFPINLTFSITCYNENMFFDCASYEKSPQSNHIFDNHIIFDNTIPNNDSCNFMKFNIKSFTPKRANLLKKSLLNLYVLYCSEPIDIEVYSVRYDWCSWELTWNNSPKHSEKIGEFRVEKQGWYSINLTNYVKSLIREEYYGLDSNSIMIKMKDTSNGKVVFSSTDNAAYPPFFQINYEKN